MGRYTKLLNRVDGYIHKHLDGRTAKAQLGISIKFLAVFMLCFFVINGLIGLIPTRDIEYVTAVFSAKLLEVIGNHAEIFIGHPTTVLLNNTHKIEIGYLCTGLLESTVIISAIIASLGISIKKRIMGIIFGLTFVNIFNLVRIVVTAEAVVNAREIQVISFIHNILFRALLFVGIGCYYAVWFFFATRKSQQ